MGISFAPHFSFISFLHCPIRWFPFRAEAFRSKTSTCAREPCRPVDEVTEERIDFMDATVNAVTTFLFNRQATLLPEREDPTTTLPPERE